MGLLRNARFSGGWWHPDNIPELQIPEFWQFEDLSDMDNDISTDAWNAYVTPEVRVLSQAFLPPTEWPIIVSLENSQVMKPFKGYGAWRAVAPPTAEWQPYTTYAIGDIVMYDGLSYSCRQAHTSLPGWEPPNVLALWLPL